MKLFRLLEVAAIVLLAGTGIWFLATRPLDDRLDTMLPQDPALRQSLQLLEDAKLSGKVVIHIQAAAPGFPHATFVRALDRLAADLHSPLISQVVTPSSAMPTPADLREFARFAPQLLPQSAYRELEPRITEEGVVQSLKAMRRSLMGLQSVAMSDWFRSDPLGARATALKPLQSLGNSMGYRTIIRDGHFFSEDLRAAMVVVETRVRITDHAGSLALIELIRGELAKLPDGLTGTIIAGHLHTLSNQRVLRRDIGRASTLGAIFFAGLFFIYFRDLRSVLIFVIPTLGVLMGIAAVGLTGTRIVAVVAGMGGMLAGIAIDYGIHVYVALSRPEVDRPRWSAVQLIQRSLWSSALTTIAPIAGLLLSTIPGYRQLGFLASTALLFSLLLAMRAFPLFFPAVVKAVPGALPSPSTAAKPGAPPGRVVALFLALLACGILAATGIKLDLGFAQLDGTEPAIINDEQAFQDQWGGGPGSMEILAVWDADPEKARQANDAVFEQITAVPGASETFFSMASVAPSRRTRETRAVLWSDFWKRNAPALQERLARHAPACGFTTNAFEPFFLSLQEGTDPAVFAPSNGLVATMERQFVRSTDTRSIILSFYKDSPAMSNALASLHDIPAPYACVSRRNMQEEFSTCIVRDLSRQAIVGLTMIGLLIAVMIRRVRPILLICIPPVTGVVGMLAGLRLAGEPLTPVSMVAGLLIIGNCFDYGIFMLEAWRRNARTGIGRGVYLAWLTTAGGAGLLLVTQHPVLHITGLALTIGVTCGYLSARWVIWPAARLLHIPTHTETPP